MKLVTLFLATVIAAIMCMPVFAQAPSTPPIYIVDFEKCNGDNQGVVLDSTGTVGIDFTGQHWDCEKSGSLIGDSTETLSWNQQQTKATAKFSGGQKYVLTSIMLAVSQRTGSMTITTDAGETGTFALSTTATTYKTGFKLPASVMTFSSAAGWVIETDNWQFTPSVAAPPPPPTITSVTVACVPTAIFSNSTSTCTATVQGTGAFSNAVTWSSSAGTVSTAGILTPNSGDTSDVVTATSVQDTTQSGSATVAVAPPNNFSIVSNLTWNDGTFVTGSLQLWQADSTGTFQQIASTTIDASGNIALAGVLDVSQANPHIQIRYIDAGGNLQATFDQQFPVALAPALKSISCAVVLEKGTNPVSLAKIPVCQ